MQKIKYPNPHRKISKPDQGEEHKLKQITCFKCRGQGRYARNCPSKHKGETDSNHVSSTSVILNIKTDIAILSILRIHTYINNKKVRAYVDLGSSVVTIKQDTLRDLGFSFYETETAPLIGYGNGQVKPLGLFTANLKIDDVVMKVPIHVVPSTSQSVSLIVGHPYTEQPNIVITSKPN
ncbi:hypothetical protein QE152_g33908 [Popillia japonica]|uniref:CCHC-type domain-containing protein n=1 Tax=Popillia japonica TaxID=7064 RepID=A0AAW1IVF5_POPJA